MLEITVRFNGTDAEYWNLREAIEQAGGYVLQSRPVGDNPSNTTEQGIY